MSGKIEVLIPEADIRERVAELGQVISESYEGKEVVLVGILTGSFYFLTELSQRIKVPVEIDFMAASSYGNATESSGQVILTKDLSRSIEGKHVIIVEDIIDSGNTLKMLGELLKKRNPASIELAVLLDKPERRVVDIEADYVGFEIPDEFVVGWGLDYRQKYRNLPYVGILKEDN